MKLKVFSKNTPEATIERIVQTLSDGGVIVYPTDTTYALGCNAMKERAVERVCKIRNIDIATHPLSIVCYDMSAISEYARIENNIYKTIRRNLPGPFTFILPGKNTLPKIFRACKGKEVGIRMPDSAVVAEIVRRLGAPLMTCSLPMPEGEEAETAYLTNPDLIEDTLGDGVDLLLDGGEGVYANSTIVDCTGDEPEIIRQGIGELQ